MIHTLQESPRCARTSSLKPRSTYMSSLYAAMRVIQCYGQPGHEGLTASLANTTLHVVPVLNPDGVV